MKKLKISTIIIAVAGLVASIFAYKGIRKGIAAWKGIEEAPEEPEEPEDQGSCDMEMAPCGDAPCDCEK